MDWEKEKAVIEEFQSAWGVFIRPRRAFESLKHFARMIDIMSDTNSLLTKENNEYYHAIREISCAVDPGKPFYSWQRIWQNAMRLRLGLPMDCSMEDIKVAMLLENTKEASGE